MSKTEVAKIEQENEESDKAKGSLDIFIPQAIKVPPRSCEQESREQGSRSSKELDVTEGDIDQQVIEKEVDDLKETVHEEKKKSKEKGEIEKEEQVKLVKEEVTHKEGWMRRKWKEWRRSDNPQKEVSPADNIVFSPPDEPAKVVRSQSPISRIGLPNTRCEATNSRLPHPRGSAKTPDKGEHEVEDGPDKTQDDIGDSSNYTRDKDLEDSHVIDKTKYGSEVVLGMSTTISTVKNPAWKSANQHVEVQVEALADSGASASIISLDLARKVKMIIFEKGDATLKDASNKNMDVSGRGEIMVQEELGLRHKIRVLISKEWVRMS